MTKIAYHRLAIMDSQIFVFDNDVSLLDSRFFSRVRIVFFSFSQFLKDQNHVFPNSRPIPCIDYHVRTLQINMQESRSYSEVYTPIPFIIILMRKAGSGRTIEMS